MARANFNQSIIPIADLELVSATTPSGTTTLSKCRGLLVGTAGTLNITLNGSNYDNVPFQAGITPGFFQEVRDGGSAENVWAIY